MAWYYKDGEQEFGPVEKNDLQALIKNKEISGSTLIRAADSDQWKPLSEMVRQKPDAGKASSSPPSQPPSPSEAIETSDAAGAFEAEQPLEMVGAAQWREQNDRPTPAAPSPQAGSVCSQCGRSFPGDQVLSFEGRVICAACKPMFVQKLKEGAAIAGMMDYAGFWIRLLAKFIDGVVLCIFQFIVMIPLILLGSTSLPADSGELTPTGISVFAIVYGVTMLLSIFLPIAYGTFFVGKLGATPGKMACRLKVVAAEGEKITYLRAMGRSFAEWLSSLILSIGYIMAAFDDEKRTLHDRVCNTRVIHKR